MKTGVSATRDAGDEIVCAAMRVLLLCAAFESCRSSVSLPVAFAGINPFFFFTSFFALSARSLSYYTALLQKSYVVKVQSWFFNKLPYHVQTQKRTFTFGRKTCLCQTNLLFRQRNKNVLVPAASRRPTARTLRRYSKYV